VGRDHGDFTGMTGADRRILGMTLLKLLITLLAAGLLTFLALPGFAASATEGVTSDPPAKPRNPAAKLRRHRRPGQHRHQRRQNQDGSLQAPG
jgi:hypothetical protein